MSGGIGDSTGAMIQILIGLCVALAIVCFVLLAVLGWIVYGG